MDTKKLRSLRREVEFLINGKKYTVGRNVPADTSLNSYIREEAHLKGTKVMCQEGGCGACIVAVTVSHSASGKPVVHAVNSCLVPVFACHGWEITTVEGLGNRKTGYDRVVSRLAAANGTQCGYCSPGMVMNMYSLLQSNPNITMKEVENSFGGNICRCTGYRPILDAFKSLASDAPEKLVLKLSDIEDLICPKSGKVCYENGCTNKCSTNCVPHNSGVEVQLDDGTAWYRPTSLSELFALLNRIGSRTYRYIAGNTGQGVYRYHQNPEIYIDLNGISDLHGLLETSNGVTFGGNVNLTEAMDHFSKLAGRNPQKFAYLETLSHHIDLIANVPVRNTGTFAGNLMLKHEHPEFPSDLFLILELAGAKLTIGDSTGEVTVDLPAFLKGNMNKKIISKIHLPHIDSCTNVVRSYKIMPRAQNAHAYVNAGFRVKLSDLSNKRAIITERPTILFGGIDPTFLHAVKTEDFLNGKVLLDNGTLQGALAVLESELKPDHILPDPSPEFRKGLALSLLYKFVLSVFPGGVKEELKSGASLLERPVSSGRQDFQTNPRVWPLNQPVPKIEALIQCAGEAEYTNDIPHIPGQVWGQLVLTQRGNANILSVDPSEALVLSGVVGFLSAKDIPGRNTFTLPQHMCGQEEPIFVNGRADYAGQAVGVILAESQSLARKAATLVKIEYTDKQIVMLDVRKIVKDEIPERVKKVMAVEKKNMGSDIKHIIKGSFDLKGQYHYTMETQSCLAVPTEDHLEIYAASQWPASLQETVSVVLNLPENYIDIRVRRLGGGYGSKITRSNHVGAVASLAAHLLHRPVRVVLDLETNAEWSGKRFPICTDYEVGVNDKGEIQYLNGAFYQDNGHSPNESPIAMGATFHHAKNTYDSSHWSLTGFGVTTDTASNTWCRAPGSTEGIAFIENVMEHISKATGIDPVAVRLANMKKNDTTLAALTKELRKISDYDLRLKNIEEFNKMNRWKKRGISLVPMNYPFSFWGNFYGVVDIFAMDGTVAITHGAIEMGQGVNTKAAQVAAHILGISLNKVMVKPTLTITSPNNAPTGGSVGSEAVCYAIKVCCEQLNERLRPVRDKLGDKASWEELCSAAARSNVNLSYTYMFTNNDDVKSYSIYGVTVTEVEVDVLTGQYHTVRVDLIEDAGESLSPEVDIGQIEGAFVMGLGYYTTEELIYASDTGRLLTNRTWNYKPPGAKDIPIDFRITLRKNAPNPTGVLRSKATGEPPLCMSCSVLFAIRYALQSARRDSGNTSEVWFDLQPPFTGEKIWLGALTRKQMFYL